MMDAHRPCPDSALLAAFLDGTLEGYERTAVVSHLAECPECRAVAITVTEFREVEALDALWEQPQMPTAPAPLLEGGVARWTREKTRAPALAIAITAALATLAVPLYYFPPSGSPQQALSTLIDVAEGQRPVEARLSGTVAYRPPPSQAGGRVLDDQARVQLITTASTIRDAFEATDEAPSRRAVGVAALLVGDLDDAIATLEIAATAAPEDPKVANDLAAAYYERAQRANRPDDLPAALSAVERVLYRDPSHQEALFNRALVITALGLRAEAARAWQRYIARDPESPWTVEARQRLDAITPDSATPAWTVVKGALDASPSAVDADLAVRHHTSAARDYVENDLLKRWLDAAGRHDETAAMEALERLRVLAASFAQIAADHLYADWLRAHDRAAESGRNTSFVLAHREYFDGLALANAQRFADALPVFRRAQARLSEVRSPLRSRAQIEVAASLYYSVKYQEAADLLHAIKRELQERRHAILVTRAAWLEGMSAFSLNEFGRAQACYEEMLNSASAAGDLDQWVMANALLASLHDTLGNSQRAWQHRIDGALRLDQVVSQLTRTLFVAGAAGDSIAADRHAAALLFQSLLLQEPAGVPPSTEAQLRAQRARSLERIDRVPEALQELERARERLNGVANADTRLRVEADVLGAEADVWSARDPVRAARAADRLVNLSVLRVGDLRRARAFLKLSNLALASGDVALADRRVRQGFAELDVLRQTVQSPFALRASDPVWQLYGTAARIALRRGDVAAAFEHTERGRVRTAQERRIWGDRVASLGQTQRALDGDTALLMLVQLGDDLHTWVVRRDRITTHTASLSRTRAAMLVAAQLQEVTRGGTTPRVSAELFDSILRPVATALSGVARVVVVADAPYHRIAFSGLWDRRQDRYLVESHQLMVAPSATAFAHAASARPRTSTHSARRAAFVAAPGMQVAVARSGVAAAALQAAYGDRLSRNDAATASDLAHEVAGADVVHIAARVLENRSFPEFSHVEMADDAGQKYSGFVFARSVAQFEQLNAQLIALERGPSDAIGTEVDRGPGLPTGLVAAGVPTVVSPVVDVAPHRIERTWIDFHRHYAAGAAPVESLRRAQLAALSDSNRRPGPWATLTVFGSGQ